MSKFLRIVLLFAILVSGTLVALPAQAGSPAALPVPGECFEGPLLPGGARALYCVPASGWNGDLVVFGHGYIAFNEPIEFYHLEIDGVSVPDLAQRLGYAFATTSYRRNGLAILEGVADLKELVESFPAVTGLTSEKTFITGASEGGIVTVLSIERHPELYTAGLSLCGPVGDMQRQIDYWGDFRTLFDYYFPGVMPLNSDTITIPPELIDTWDSVYSLAVADALAANPDAAAQLIRTSRAPIDRADPATTTKDTTLQLLWYNVFATEDGQVQFGGNPFDNTERIYWAAQDFVDLNRNVRRYVADEAALAAVQPYNTSGMVTRTLVTMHTTGDEVIPFWHQRLYRQKLLANGVTDVVQLPVFRYGHCEFKAVEILVGIALMVSRSTGEQTLDLPEYDLSATRMNLEQARRAFEQGKVE